MWIDKFLAVCYNRDVKRKYAAYDSKLATTTSSGGLLLALKRAVCVRA